jgi:hypothetical protein
MRTSREGFQKILFGAGVTAIVIGIATMIYALAFLGPRVSSLSKELSGILIVAENGLLLLERDGGLVETSLHALDQTKATLRQSAEALRATAVALDEVESPTGLIIPGESLEAGASELQSTATEVDLLATRIEEIQKEGAVVGETSIRAVLADLRTHLGDAERALSRVPSVQGAVALTILQGGLYVLLGVLALALSGVMGRIDRLVRWDHPSAEA